MIKLNIKHTKINASCLETLVEGNVNSVFAEFTFSPEWDNLSRVAIFSNGTSKISVALSENTCAIPWEMLSCPGELIVAVRGIGDGGNIVVCTENASLGKIIESLADDDADEPEDASPSVIDSMLADIAALKAAGGTEIEGVYASVEDLSEHTEDTTIHVAASEKAVWNSKSSFSGSYNDLLDKPEIPSEVTESTVSGWGFTKSNGTYSKPSGGIPESDLASGVQTSLGKADSALQEHQSASDLFDSFSITVTYDDDTVSNYDLAVFKE